MTENNRYTINGKWAKSLHQLNGVICKNNEPMMMTDVKRELNELHEQIQDLMKYKYFVKALEEVSGSHYIDEIISDWTDGDLFDADEQIKLGKQVVEKGLSWEEVE